MVCACSLSEHYKHALCLTTACFIAPPALLLLVRGHQVLGGLAVGLCLTSVLYHSTHNLLIRTADVSIARATVLIGTAIQFGQIWQHGSTSAGVGAILCELLVRKSAPHRTRFAPEPASQAKLYRSHACRSAAQLSSRIPAKKSTPRASAARARCHARRVWRGSLLDGVRGMMLVSNNIWCFLIEVSNDYSPPSPSPAPLPHSPPSIASTHAPKGRRGQHQCLSFTGKGLSANQTHLHDLIKQVGTLPRL